MYSMMISLLIVMWLNVTNADFSWGMIQSINAYNSTSAFLVVLVLLVLLEFCLPFIEYAVRDEPIARSIIKCLVKQLAAFGMISILIMGYIASEDAALVQEYSLGLNNAYYVLVFTYIFYLMHMLFLLYIAVLSILF